MRPVRRYELHFTHPQAASPVKLMTCGDTPCNAKAVGWTLLERLLAIDDTLPRNGWRLDYFEDCGMAGS